MVCILIGARELSAANYANLRAMSTLIFCVDLIVVFVSNPVCSLSHNFVTLCANNLCVC